MPTNTNVLGYDCYCCGTRCSNRQSLVNHLKKNCAARKTGQYKEMTCLQLTELSCFINSRLLKETAERIHNFVEASMYTIGNLNDAVQRAENAIATFGKNRQEEDRHVGIRLTGIEQCLIASAVSTNKK